MADILLQQAYTRAMSTNNLYQRSIDRWRFLLDSYVGGEDYRRGAYLTRYQLETDSEYSQRLRNTPLDNQCRSLISLYVSFIFRDDPEREFNAMDNDPTIEAILEDADLDGRSIDAFMKEASIWASVFGHTWIVVSKPNVQALTLADEIAQGVRPYLSIITPLCVTDWRWERQPNGSFELSYIKYVEEVNDTVNVVKEWSKDVICTTVISLKDKVATDYYEEVNELGRLPFICLYAERGIVRGLGMSLIEDTADQQRAIYNELSEVESSIRLDSHPSLVCTSDTNVGTGAGALIHMPENMDPALKPYVLEFSGATVDSIYKSIEERKKMIDSMASVGSIRVTETREMSGIAMQTEMTLLNARLCSIADNIELAEEQIWQEIYTYLGVQWDGTIDYPGNFALHNLDNELDQLAKMKGLTANPLVQDAIDKKIAEILDIEQIEMEAGDVVEGETIITPQGQVLPGPFADTAGME